MNRIDSIDFDNPSLTNKTSHQNVVGNEAKWWRESVIYQVYPRSFADSNGDGVGDLAGIVSKIEHLAKLGGDAIWISPFYPSPQVDAGYDVSNYRDVDPIFGDLSDFDELLKQAKTHHIKVIVDLVPNHCSDQHPWFQAALIAGPGSAARALFHFKESPDDNPPNNWTSMFQGPAWTRAKDHPQAKELGVEDNEWYLNLFDSAQPDFNWDNPKVKEEFESILRFWLAKGVDGFRVDVSHGLIKKPGLPNWDGSIAMIQGEQEAKDNSEHIAQRENAAPFFDQDPVHEIYRSWRKILNEYSPERMMVAEAWVDPLERLANYVRSDEMHQAFNFEYLVQPFDATKVRHTIKRSLKVNALVGAPTTWVLSNHDTVRHVSRLGLDHSIPHHGGIGPNDPQPDLEMGQRRGAAMTLQMLALPGSAYIYQGEELGLPEHTKLAEQARQDPTWERSKHTQVGRDGCRIPLPWDNNAPAFGFNESGNTWLPQPQSYRQYAVNVQDEDPASMLNLYRKAIRIRKERGLGRGELQWLAEYEEGEVVAFKNGALTCLTTFANQTITLPTEITVLISTQDLEAGPGGTLMVPAETTLWFT